MSIMDDAPTHLGRYRIECVLGRGAMGIVYLAFDPHIEREVALKTIRSELLQSSAEGLTTHDLRLRFLNEARAAGRLAHPNIVAVYDFGETDTIAYLTMEYVPGESLAARLAQHARAATRIAPERALGWFLQLLDALDYAHERRVIHRDIKPANLLIAPRGECKITDFGIAQIETSRMTQAGTLIGTPSYMSPEQFTGAPVDTRADLFSAAIVLYEMLAGVCPFVGTPSEVMQQILNETPRAPSAHNGALSADVDAILLKALAKRPEDRFGSAREWRDTLLDTMSAMHDGDVERTVFTALRQPAGLEPPVETSAPAQWSPDFLARLEQGLASHVGPVATFLMRRAASQATDARTLLERLTAHLPTEAARRDFQALLSRLLAEHERAGMRPATIGTGSTSAPPGKASQAAGVIEANVIDEASRRLATYLGPIAKVVATRAARKATDTNTFHTMLVDALPDSKDKEAFRRDLGLLPD
jgi:serine/threonine-protein kinase